MDYELFNVALEVEALEGSLRGLERLLADYIKVAGDATGLVAFSRLAHAYAEQAEHVGCMLYELAKTDEEEE